jgi:large subunit ribosomal protein L35
MGTRHLANPFLFFLYFFYFLYFSPYSPFTSSRLPITLSPRMPKMKSHSGAKKRIRRTGSGKLVFKRNSRNHLLLQKSRRQKRLKRTQLLHSTNERAIRHLVSYI